MLKESFKYYKRKCPPPGLEEVIDFSNEGVSKNFVTPSIGISNYALGLTPSSDWKLFSLEEKPGLIFISNPFTKIGQRYWIYRCLKHYSKKPNRLNLDVHGDVKHGDWWSECQSDYGQNSKLMEKLRWATLGYHHNWDTKVYSENERTDFPEDLSALSREVAHIVGFSKFSAEAAIINYYHMDSTLSCHTDHSEFNLDAPLLSFRSSQMYLVNEYFELLENSDKDLGVKTIIFTPPLDGPDVVTDEGSGCSKFGHILKFQTKASKQYFQETDALLMRQ